MFRRFPYLTLILLILLATACVEKKKDQVRKPPPPEATEKTKPDKKHKPEKSHPGKGVYHTVLKGQTFWRICKNYGADMDVVAKANNITDPTQIKVGQKIWIPGAKKIVDVDIYNPPAGGAASPGKPSPKPGGSPSPGKPTPPPTAAKGALLWPVPTMHKIYSPYGMRNGRMHDGVDFAAAVGTTVVAADDGKITHSGAIPGYGNVIIIKHAGKLQTVYAHNRVNLVKVGEFVGRGQKIAEVGNTGRSTGPHLHFEVRVGGKPVNPTFYLP